MAAEGVKSRTYSSPLRAEQARRTRSRVLETTRELLIERGYAGVTMADVASAAGVSVPLLYKVFGTKPDLVKQVYDVTLAGDDEERSIADRPGIAGVFADPDPRSKLVRYARMSREMAARAGRLVSVLRAGARAGDAELMAFLETTDAERLTGATALVRHLQEAGGLRPGLDAGRARDLVWLAISPEVFELLVLDRGWSLDDYEAWLTEELSAALLG
ncbi:MAG TPA: helix-turn-helix domain-containing protein [Kineosporiaceae bacterium]|nr:helix-turn-helix domain-containing protein [Kineosporiaceae bacterium]